MIVRTVSASILPSRWRHPIVRFRLARARRRWRRLVRKYPLVAEVDRDIERALLFGEEDPSHGP